jgi:membrane dipeptidase
LGSQNPCAGGRGRGRAGATTVTTGGGGGATTVGPAAQRGRGGRGAALAALKKNGGVVQVVAFASYVKTDSPERKAALDALRKEFKLPAGTNLGGGGRGRGAGRAGLAGPRSGAPGSDVAAFGPQNPCVPQRGAGGAGLSGPPAQGRGGRGGRGNALAALSDEQRADLQTILEALNAYFPPPARASVKDFVDLFDYAVQKVGIDHVGISSDFDGGGGVDGWNGADETFNVTLELVKRGYTEDQIAKIWSGNLLRVMDDVQAVARRRR